jgi:hypothetical protein
MSDSGTNSGPLAGFGEKQTFHGIGFTVIGAAVPEEVRSAIAFD